jgi:malonyl-CoA/methylmalonyl-CoA synthetase
MTSAPLFPALAHPSSSPALFAGDTSLDYAALARACAAHASALSRAGVSAGDRVAVWTHHGAETLVALTAHALSGVVSVPLNPALGDRELEHILRDAAPRLALAREPALVAARHPSLPTHALALDTTATHAPPVAPVDDAPALVVYTSGTTGAPKGAVLTRRNIAACVDALARAWAWSERDALVHALPVFHVHGLVLGLFGTLRAGASVRWLAKFAPDAVADALERGATLLFGVPTMYHRLADAAEREPRVATALARARLLVSGSAPLPVREHARLERATGRRVLERYGLTETLIVSAVRHDDAPCAGSVGRAVEGVELRLVDDARAPIDARDGATIGEVAVRGATVFEGYLNRPDATAAVRDADGWFYTGDLATMAPDGSLRIVGRRATDLIKTGGFKVGAGEVEAALLEHASVAEAAVIAVPDDDLGEKIVAYVVVREGHARDEGALAEHVARALAPHKRPRAVRFVDELPRNAMGKVLKPALRAREQG